MAQKLVQVIVHPQKSVQQCRTYIYFQQIWKSLSIFLTRYLEIDINLMKKYVLSVSKVFKMNYYDTEEV